MGAVADRHPPVQVFVHHHRGPRQSIAPARLLDLKHPVISLNRVVLVDRAFVLQAEDQIQIPAPTAYKRRTLLSRRHTEAAVELGHVLLTQELVGLVPVRYAPYP